VPPRTLWDTWLRGEEETEKVTTENPDSADLGFRFEKAFQANRATFEDCGRIRGSRL
jgi:hypothetical protein